MLQAYLIQALTICLLAILDIAFVNQLPFGLDRLHLLPLALVFVYLLSNSKLTAMWTVIGGLILETFSFGVFGFHLLGLALGLLCISFLFERVITNHSLYSITLVGMVTVLLYDASQHFKVSFEGSPWQWSEFIQQELLTLLYSGILCLIAFYVINMITRRLRPVFLAKKNYQL